MERTTVNRVHGWFWQRITAFILFVGLFMHFAAVHFLIERPVTFAKITERFTHPFWITFDIILLLCAIYHGLNGLWNIFVDYKLSSITKRIIGWILVVLGFAMSLFGIFILFPFKNF